jgi:acyl-CoA thioesterase-1
MTIGQGITGLVAALSLAGAAAAATPAVDPPRVGVLDDPCAAVEPAPAMVTAYMSSVTQAKAAHAPSPTPSPEALKVFNDWQRRLLVSDFAGLCHYHAANAKLPAAGADRTVFFGDSITELWGIAAPDLFRDDVIDRGVSGQTTAQMLGRFRADVIDLHPKIVHILAGTNDIAGNTGPTQLAWIEANIETMVELARAHHIVVVLGAIPPSRGFTWRPAITPAATIVAYDRWLADFAQREKLRFVDYHAVLDDGEGGIHPGLTDDGTHPNAAGFQLMTSIVEQTIRPLRKHSSSM